MRKLTKKLGSLLLAAICAVSLTFGSSVTAFAGTAPAGGYQDTTITLDGVATGDTAYAYKLVSYGDNWNSYVFDSTDGKGFEQFADSKAGSGRTRDAWFAGLATTGADNLEKVIEEFVSGTTGSSPAYSLPAPFASAQAADGKASLNLQPGYYAIIVKTTQGNSKIYRPITAFVKVDGNSTATTIAGEALPANGIVKVKSTDGPSIDKTVRADATGTWNKTATASVGDTVQFCVKVTLPTYNNANIAVTDLGLAINENMTNLAYLGASGVKAYASLSDGKEPANEIEGAATAKLNDSGQLESIGIDYGKVKNATLTENTFYVVYSATVLSDMAETDTASNSATLTYRTNSVGDTSTTEASTTNVYGYSFDVQKVKNDGGATLENAKFKVYPQNDNTTPLSFVKEGNYYRLATEKDADSVEKVTEIAASDGTGKNTFMVKGLKAGTYYLEESTTPNGYYAPAGKFQVALVASSAGGSEIDRKLDGANSAVSAVETADAKLINGTAENDNLTIKVINSTTPSLPTTGGMGTVLITILGVVLMAAAGAFFVLRRKQR